MINIGVVLPVGNRWFHSQNISPKAFDKLLAAVVWSVRDVVQMDVAVLELTQ
jgi:hypothetical protein